MYNYRRLIIIMVFCFPVLRLLSNEIVLAKGIGALSVGVRNNFLTSKFTLYFDGKDLLIANSFSMNINNAALNIYYNERRKSKAGSITLTLHFASGKHEMPE